MYIRWGIYFLGKNFEAFLKIMGILNILGLFLNKFSDIMLYMKSYYKKYTRINNYWKQIDKWEWLFDVIEFSWRIMQFYDFQMRSDIEWICRVLLWIYVNTFQQ